MSATVQKYHSRNCLRHRWNWTAPSTWASACPLTSRSCCGLRLSLLVSFSISKCNALDPIGCSSIFKAKCLDDVLTGGAEIYRNNNTDPETRLYPGGAFDPLGRYPEQPPEKCLVKRHNAGTRKWLYWMIQGCLLIPIANTSCERQSSSMGGWR